MIDKKPRNAMISTFRLFICRAFVGLGARVRRDGSRTAWTIVPVSDTGTQYPRPKDWSRKTTQQQIDVTQALAKRCCILFHRDQRLM
jgi:hypothetical protein